MVYVFLANGFEEIEALCVVDFLRRCGICVQMVSITDEKTVTGSHSIPVVADCILTEVDTQKATAFVLPGGLPGADNLQNCASLREILTNANREKRVIGAICAAPKVLGAFGILKGRKATCYPGFEEELIGAKALSEPVVCDGHIVTSRGVATAPAFAFSLAEALGVNPQKVRTAMLFND
ncbi:MAG: DJ-1/PfpI family protein [Ruminococcaceae bacterium]|nr:DJ-1/PfpI family protein [Oscillospiraceae bacterium]